MFFENENVQELLNGLIKIGEVSSIDPAKGTARVVFDDDDSIVSFDLQVLQRNTFRNHDYAMPDVGEDVLCLFLASGVEEGFILGSVYAGEVCPPESSVDKRTVVFDDGTKVSYDRGSHTLSVQIENTNIVADRSSVVIETTSEIRDEAPLVTIKGGSQVNVEGGASINLKAPTVTLTMGGTTMVLNGSKATIKASSLEFEGTMSVKGALSVAGSISSTGSISAAGTVSGSNI